VAAPPLPETFGTVTSQVALHGGDIAHAWRVTTDRGLDLVVKATPYDATLEAEGLTALRDAGAPVPTVHHVGARLLVMDAVAGDGDLAGLGIALARVHAADAGDTFGWHRDNLLGTVEQVNTPMANWSDFFVACRIQPHLPHLPTGLAHRLERACAGPLPALLDHDVRPSLVHGDLWPGNVVDGTWLIDPAVHRADAEVDLAAAALFGGLASAFLDGYQRVASLDPGWRERQPILQLPHLLVHVRMFGAGWLGAVSARLDARGW
jgi:fructosamine-3-kinase